MAKKHGIDNFADNEGLVPDDDFEYEKQLAAEEQSRREAAEEKVRQQEEELRRREREERDARDRQIANDKIALMKMKSGIADEEDEIKEEHTEKRELKGKEKLANIWYHDKVWICFGAFLIAVIAFMVYDTVTREKPDITVMMISDSGLSLYTSQLEELFEEYTPDLNGDGKIHVSIMDIPLNDNKADNMYTTNSQKFYANLQQGSIIMVITDSNTDPEYLELMDRTLPEKFPDNKYVDENGFSMNMQTIANRIGFQNMPNDIHLSLRAPVSTLDDTVEEMQENYDVNFEIFENMVNSLTELAELQEDKGLDTEPADNGAKADSLSETDVKSENDTDD